MPCSLRWHIPAFAPSIEFKEKNILEMFQFLHFALHFLASTTSVTIFKLQNFFALFHLTSKVFGFEQTYVYEILLRGPLGTSECAGECRLSANLCKRALDVTAGVIVEATRNADIF